MLTLHILRREAQWLELQSLLCVIRRTLNTKRKKQRLREDVSGKADLVWGVGGGS